MSAATKLKRSDPRHGTANGYHNLGCRCPRCQCAHAALLRSYRSRSESWGAEARKRRYAQAREAEYSSYEAAKRSHWADPLADRPPA